MSIASDKPLMLICSQCSMQIRNLTTADVPERGIVCRCGHRLLPATLKIDSRPRIVTPIDGPGTELKQLLTELGIVSLGGCGCESKAAQMNRWGVDGCRENFKKIRNWIAAAQAKADWLTTITAATRAAASGIAIHIDPLDIPGSLVRLAIERAENRK